MKVGVVRNSVITVTLSDEEASILRSIGGLAGYTTEQCSQEYRWNGDDHERVEEFLLSLYYGLTEAGVLMYNDRRKGGK